MELRIFDTADQLGAAAAKFTADVLRRAIAHQGNARIVLSTGASQFTTFKYLIQQDIDWSKVEMFHLDEYIGLPYAHKASFRKYLQERFLDHIQPLKAVHFVDGEIDPKQCIANLTGEIRKAPVDIGLIGIGENAHIAFNDPPADFATRDAFLVVHLDDACKNQQVGEGWFPDVDAVPDAAITMSVHQIMACRTILSCVPYAGKAKAVAAVWANETSPAIPATILKEHPDFHLYLDQDSAANLPSEARPR